MNIPVNSIICHDVVKPFPLIDECIDVVITSPPYWGLRDYGIKNIFGGDPKCKHIFSEYDAGNISTSYPSLTNAIATCRST